MSDSILRVLLYKEAILFMLVFKSCLFSRKGVKAMSWLSKNIIKYKRNESMCFTQLLEGWYSTIPLFTL